MAKKDKAFNDLLDTALGMETSFSDMISTANEVVIKNPAHVAAVPAARRIEPTKEQKKAIEEAQNSQRGRGKKKGERTMIAFKVPNDMLERLEDLHYSTGITKNDLYNEALELLLKKYKNI